MKKMLSLALVLALTASLAGCGGTPQAPAADSGAPSGGEAASYSFSVGTNTAEDSVNHLLAAKFKELLEERSGGAATVTLYENGQMGGDAELTESCIAGSVDFIVGMTGSLVNYIPEAALFDLPNVFPDLETARKVLDGPILQELQSAYEAGGLKLFGYADSGFRVMSSNKAVRALSDFSGVKIRTMENANHIAYWQALGANPTPMDFGELYISLEQNVLDAQENPYDLIVANKLYEPQAYVVETNHLLHTLNMVGSKATYDALPADMQALVSECAAEAHQYARQMASERIDNQKTVIQDAGLEIITLDEGTIQAMAEAASDVYDLVRGQVGDQLVDNLIAQVDGAK
ncbi:TRAP transporter substrate-binding protein [uncultured Oscillibacter sp.]|uniref:TRAP transporter substrate-binding protein n=1 Tax=uncultured Oscillibacter sp. TaxID=876091 RepID=UPI0025E5E3E9|nr:TRAP transporter substrate-binding protein [uncultured Oscillibacter sp.]